MVIQESSPLWNIVHKYGEKLTSVNLIPAAYAEDDVPAGKEVHRTYVWDVNLPKVDLSHAWLDYTDFTNANLTLEDANLDSGQMYNAILDKATLTNANLNYAKLVGTRMDWSSSGKHYWEVFGTKEYYNAEKVILNMLIWNRPPWILGTMIYSQFTGASFEGSCLDRLAFH